MSILNLEELKKSMYPAYTTNSLAFDPISNKSVLLKTDDIVCYMAYHKNEDGNYGVFFSQTVKLLGKDNILFIFRLICDIKTFEGLGDGKEIIENLLNEFFKIDKYPTYKKTEKIKNTRCKGPYPEMSQMILDSPHMCLDILSIDTFPDFFPNTDRSQMYGFMLEGTDFDNKIHRRNMYPNIMSKSIFEYKDGEPSDVICVRIIKYENDTEYILDVNSCTDHYSNTERDKNYYVWFFSIPKSNIPEAEAVDLLFAKFKAIRSGERSMNFNEFKKAMYPNCLRDSLIYDYRLNKSVNVEDMIYDSYECYMSYFHRDDCYDVSFFQTLDELNKFEYGSLFVFRVACEKKLFDKLGGDHNDGSCFQISEMLHSRHFSIIRDTYPSFDILTTDNFPDVSIKSLSVKLNKSQMNDKTCGKYPELKRDIYMNITSNDTFESDPLALAEIDKETRDKYDQEKTLFELETGEEYKVEYKEHIGMIYVRIIGHMIDGLMTFEIDVNSNEDSYPYDDYDVWFYAIPDSNIPRSVAVNLLFNKFKEAYSKSC